MTLDEKLNQLHQDTHGWLYNHRADKEAFHEFFKGDSRGGISVFDVETEKLARFTRDVHEHVTRKTRPGPPCIRKPLHKARLGIRR